VFCIGKKYIAANSSQKQEIQDLYTQKSIQLIKFQFENELCVCL